MPFGVSIDNFLGKSAAGTQWISARTGDLCHSGGGVGVDMDPENDARGSPWWPDIGGGYQVLGVR